MEEKKVSAYLKSRFLHYDHHSLRHLYKYMRGQTWMNYIQMQTRSREVGLLCGGKRVGY